MLTHPTRAALSAAATILSLTLTVAITRAGDPAAPAPTVVALAVRGDVALERGGAASPLRRFELLYAGDVIAPRSVTSEAVLLDRAGRTETIRERRALAAPAGERSDGGAVFAALCAKLERMGGPATALGPAAATRNGPPVPTHLAPRLRVRETHPHLSWRETRPGSRYRLRLERQGADRSAWTEVLTTEVTGGAFDHPADRPPLEAGFHRFTLEVLDAKGGGGADPADLRSEEGRFLVLDDAARKRIDEEIAAFERTLPEGDARLRRVLRACFLERDGIYLLDEARRELSAVAEMAPGDEGVRRMAEEVERREGL